jgi:hypothetical protein
MASFSVRVPQVRYSEPVLSSEPRSTGSAYRTRGTRKLDCDVTLEVENVDRINH